MGETPLENITEAELLARGEVEAQVIELALISLSVCCFLDWFMIYISGISNISPFNNQWLRTCFLLFCIVADVKPFNNQWLHTFFLLLCIVADVNFHPGKKIFCYS